jgi:hypothetical protein
VFFIWFLCSSVSFLPVPAFNIFCSYLPSNETAFSTLATSLSLATELGSIVFKNHTTEATSHIAVCGLFKRTKVVLACDN